MTDDTGDSAVAALVAALGERVVVDPDVMVAFRYDSAVDVPAGCAIAVVRARSVVDVTATLRIATHYRVPVVTRGAGTGLAGGANAVEGCIVLSTAEMNRIVDVDPVGQTATVEPGVLNGDLACAASAVGLWYAPDPASRAISTIGGNIATNAGGACCVKYGVTGDHVAQLKVALADGSVIATGSRTRKNVTGYDLTRLVVGSEGTLGVVVEATVRLRPSPHAVATLVASFASASAAGRAVMAMAGVVEPSLLELMDAATIRAVEEATGMGLDLAAGALLIAQCDTRFAEIDIALVAEVCRSSDATFVGQAVDEEEATVFLHARRQALPALERQGSVLLDDIAVPISRLAEALTEIAGVARRRGVLIGTFGHAGDGNLHPTIVFDPASATSRSAAKLAFDDIVQLALRLGGSITGEHGVGVLKVPYLTDALGGLERDLMARIKFCFDPLGILNPGKAI
ncbi:MAG TPA: FAD-linked oxidase C-terminal domain-containing protein [Ilumatobacteraceae bacterium]|nr:FAD-linked oxidase C-terminal domain-containing protein [Ilumatobacteraceae bacterium]